MEWLKKITDIIMPPIDPPEEEPERVEPKKSEATVKESEQKIEAPLAGSTVGKVETMSSESAEQQQATATTAASGYGYGSAMKFGASGSAYSGSGSYSTASTMRPPLTVVENKLKELNVKVYNPTKYDQAEAIAADILGRNAAVVNYEYVESSVQLRICDFLNGVCYVTDGYTDKISEKIFLYVPEGVDTVDIAEAVSTMNNGQFRRGMFAS